MTTNLRTSLANHPFFLAQGGGPLADGLRDLITALETRLDDTEADTVTNTDLIVANAVDIAQGGNDPTTATATALSAGRYKTAGSTGLAMTLPVATGTGNVIEVYIGATVSSGSHTITVESATVGTDIMQGHVGLASDASGIIVTTAADSDTITLNGSTQGGVAGGYLKFIDVATGVWNVTGHVVASGSESTFFGAGVSAP